MRRWSIIAAILLACMGTANAWWQSRDSNYNTNIAAGGSPVWTFTDAQFNTACSNPCTQAINVNPGYVVVVVGGLLGGSGTATLAAPTLCSVTLTSITGSGNFNTGQDIEIWGGTVGCSGSQTISVATTNPANSWTKMYVAIGTLTNLSSTTPTGTCHATDLAVANTVTCGSSLTVATGGFAIVGGLNSFTTTFTSSTMTLDSSTNDAVNMSGAIGHNSTPGTLTPSLTLSVSFTNKGVVAATWR